jgi:hypothetical protein
MGIEGLGTNIFNDLPGELRDALNMNLESIKSLLRSHPVFVILVLAFAAVITTLLITVVFLERWLEARRRRYERLDSTK